MTRFTVTSKPTFRDLQGRFARAEKELIDIRRDELRAEGRLLVKLVQKKTEQKVKQRNAKLEQGIRFKTFISGDDVRLSVTAPEKAAPHRIQAKNAKALAFGWPKIGMNVIVPKAGGFKTHVRNGRLWVGKGYVDHPGGTLVPLFTPILAASLREWESSRGRIVLNRISLRYVAEVEK